MSSGPDFQTDLERGQEAEKKFMKLHCLDLKKPTHLKWDFDGPNGERVELKADSYDPNRTPNLFMERWSDVDRKKPGGPWRALENGANIFCYWFVMGDYFLECRNLPGLVKFLDEEILTAKKVSVKNKTWTTVGYLVPRDRLLMYFDFYHTIT